MSASTTVTPLAWQSKASALQQFGWQTSAIAVALNVSTREVQQWLGQCPQPDIPDNQNIALQQRSSLPRETDIYRLANLLKRPPSDYGFERETWINADIQVLVQQAFDLVIPMAALKRILQKIDWQKHQQKRQQIHLLQWWELQHHGWSVQAIADKYDVTPTEVEAVYATSIIQAHSSRLSRRRSSVWTKLSEDQMRQLPELLLKPPAAYGLVGEVWTQKKIAQLIEQVYQVSFSPHYISYLLKRIRGRLQEGMIQYD